MGMNEFCYVRDASAADKINEDENKHEGIDPQSQDDFS